MHSNVKPSIVVITGTTCSGKSSLGFALQKIIPFEIVNADSVQVYKGFNIGAAKPSKEILDSISNHLFSIIEPTENFDAGLFSQLAHNCIEQITLCKNFPLFVGGTGLYLTALLNGLVETEQISEYARQILKRKEDEISFVTSDKVERSRLLHEYLNSIGSWTASHIHINDYQRLRRAVLVGLSQGASLSMLQGQHGHANNMYRALVIVILPERKSLFSAIDRRVEEMISSGLLEEVISLRERYPLSCRPFGAIGYRHVNMYLDAQASYEQMIGLFKRDTRRFAKRQITWWRNQPKRLKWKEVSINEAIRSPSDIFNSAKQVISDFINRKGVFVGDDVWVVNVLAEEIFT